MTALAAAPPPPPPRPSPIFVGGASEHSAFFAGGITLAIALVGLVIVFATMRPPWDDGILDRRGVSTTAHAISVRETNTAVDEEGTIHEIVLRFTNRGGRQETTTLETTSSATISAAREGGSFAIEYDPEKPSRARFAGRLASPSGWAFWLIAVFALAGLPVLAYGLRRAWRLRRITGHGEVAKARVVEVVTLYPVEDGVLSKMTYEFDAPAGLTRGEWKTLTPNRVGDELWILYDRSHPGRNMPASPT